LRATHITHFLPFASKISPLISVIFIYTHFYLPPHWKVKSLDTHGHGCPVLWVDYGFKCTVSGSVGSGGEALMVCVYVWGLV